MVLVDKIKLIDKIWDCEHIDLMPNQRCILLCMAWLYQGEDQPIPISIGRIAAKTNIGSQAVERNVRHLIREGYIERVKVHTANDPAEYLFIPERLNLCGK